MYSPGQQLPEFHFFVLCKGNNSGRPSYQPNPNCFVVSAATRAELEHLYWLSFAAWQGRAFYILLRGSVIPFIRICDYQQVMQEIGTRITANNANLPKLIAALTAITERQTNLRTQLRALDDMKKLLLHRATQ